MGNVSRVVQEAPQGLEDAAVTVEIAGMRRALPQPHLTDRVTMWRSGAAILGIATIMSIFEGVLQRSSGRMLGVWLGGAIPALGGVIAWKYGPLLRPRRSYQVGRAFLLTASLPI